MTKLAKSAALSALAAAGLALSACDSESEAEAQVEDIAEAVEEHDDAEADLVEAMAVGGPNEEAAEVQAEAIRERGEAKADQLEEMADEMADPPQ